MELRLWNVTPGLLAPVPATPPTWLHVFPAAPAAGRLVLLPSTGPL